MFRNMWRPRVTLNLWIAAGRDQCRCDNLDMMTVKKINTKAMKRYETTGDRYVHKWEQPWIFKVDAGQSLGPGRLSQRMLDNRYLTDKYLNKNILTNIRTIFKQIFKIQLDTGQRRAFTHAACFLSQTLPVIWFHFQLLKIYWQLQNNWYM